mgnify:CR=1 FL=1
MPVSHDLNRASEQAGLDGRPIDSPSRHEHFDPAVRNWKDRKMTEKSTSKSIVMYSRAACPFCVAARNTLRSKDLAWTEVSLDAEPDKRAEMISRTGRKTVPQIFFGDFHVGGFDDLDALEQAGDLDRILAG